MSKSLLQTAANAITLGLSVMPIAGHDWKESDGSSLAKRPYWMNGEGPKPFKWQEYQTRLMQAEEIERFFKATPNMAMICGAVSGGLEAADFDEPGIFDKWKEVMLEHGYESIVERMVVQATMRPGRYHGIYRCTEIIEPGRKIAHREANAEELLSKPKEKVKCTIETRGEGQYFLCAPSEGYSLIQGSFAKIPVFTAEERGAILLAARICSELDVDEPDYRAPTKQAVGGDLRPGDDFMAKTDWSELLEPAGWQMKSRRGKLTTWVRPGKELREGIGAVSGLGRSGQDLLRCHSTNAYPLDGGKTYDKIGAYAAFNHGGDLAASIKDFVSRGYGSVTTRQSSKTRAQVPAGEGESKTTGAIALPAGSNDYQAFFTPVKWSELKSRPPKPMLVEGLFGVKDLVMFFGPPKKGKTFLVFDLLMACITGGSFANRFDVVRPLNVAYCTNEGKGSIHTRLKAAQSYLGVPDQTIEERFFYFEELPQLYEQNSPAAIYHFVEDWLKGGFPPLDVLVLDTMNGAILGSDENSNSEAPGNIRNAALARDALGCTPIFIHHAGHNGQLRGASAYPAAMDVLLKATFVDDEKSDAEPLRTLEMEFAKDLDAFEPVPFHLVRHDETCVIGWPMDERMRTLERMTALKAALQVMADGDQEWWGLTSLANKVPQKYDAVRTALAEDAKNPQGMVEKRGEREATEYRRKAK